MELKSRYTIAIVTHNMQQAARVSDFTAFFYRGHILDFGATGDIFNKYSLLEDMPPQGTPGCSFWKINRKYRTPS